MAFNPRMFGMSTPGQPGQPGQEQASKQKDCQGEEDGERIRRLVMGDNNGASKTR